MLVALVVYHTIWYMVVMFIRVSSNLFKFTCIV